MLPLPSGGRLLFGQHSMLLGDELAIKTIVSCKGASGLKMCLYCQNVADHRSPMLPDTTGFLVPSTCLELRRFQLAHDGDTKVIMRRLRDARATHNVEQFKILQRNLGYTYHVHSPMLAVDLDYKPH